DHQLRAVGALLGLLGEALLAERTAARAQALPMRHRHLTPGALGVARRVVALTRSALGGLLLDPLPQLEHLRARAADLLDVDQRALVAGHALADPVQAGVVAPALEHGVRRRAEAVTEGADQRREVAFDELVLK